MVLVVAVVVSTGGRRRGCCGRSGGRGYGSAGGVMTVAGRGSGRGGRGRQVMAHSRVVRPGGCHGRRGWPEPVRGVRHLAAGGQVAVSHGRVVHVRGGRRARQAVEVGLVQVRVVHVVAGERVLSPHRARDVPACTHCCDGSRERLLARRGRPSSRRVHCAIAYSYCRSKGRCRDNCCYF